jgi:hypothetical protein
MSVRNASVLFLALCTLALLVGCGSSTPKAVAPPSGGFSASNFSGTYVFSLSGADFNGAFLTIAGDVVADGSGLIKGGNIDVLDGASGASLGNTITGGSYTVGVDGRGKATLNTGNGTLALDFVLTSSTHGLVTEFDSNGTGSGTIDLQPTVLAQSALSGLSYTFNLAGVGSTSSFATVGTVTLGATGSVTAGVQDINDGGLPTPNSPISTSSFVTVGTGTTPGTASIITSLGTFNFNVYVIDATHIKLIENDGVLLLSGDAYTAAAALPASATLAFTMAGFDAGSAPLAMGGIFPTDANSNVLTGGVEDFNDNGLQVAQDTSFGGGFSPISGGRSVLTLTTFVNGAANDVSGTYTFAAYPFTSNGVTGIQLLEIDNSATIGFNGVTQGAAFVQTSTTLAATQGYGFDLSAINVGGITGAFEEDDIAEFVTSSSGFTGLVDINDEGSFSNPQTFSGTYTAGGTGRYTATTTEHGNPFVGYAFYVVNGSTFLVLETDNNQIGLGIFEEQSAAGSPGTAQPGISMLRAPVSPHPGLRRKQ